MGSSIGYFIGHRIRESIRTIVVQVIGLATVIMGISNAMDTHNLVFPLVGMVIGAVIGELLHIEERLEGIGERLKKRFAKKSDDSSTFVEGFVAASLLFAIGPLAILGSISDGMGTGIDQLILKSTLDFFAAMAFATSLGWGVAVSALPVGIYQGVWTVIGFGLGEILDGYQVDAMTVVGGIMLICIAFRLLNIKSVAVGNLLPALAIAPLFALIVHSI